MEKSRWISDLHWVRHGQQTRSQRTQTALLDSAEELFAENGLDGTSVADIADRAGCSVGAVYHHFSDKKAVLLALFERLAAELEATTQEAVDPGLWGDASIGDILTAYVQFTLMGRVERPSMKPVMLEAARQDPNLASRYTELLGDLDQGLTDLMVARRDEIGHPDPEVAIRFVLEQLGSMLGIRSTGAPMPTRLGEDPDEVFIVEAVRSVCGYLRIPVPASL